MSDIPTSEIDFEEQAALIGQGPAVCMVAREDMLKLFAEITRLRKELAGWQKCAKLRSQERDAARVRERQARDEARIAIRAANYNVKRLAEQLMEARDVLHKHGLLDHYMATLPTF